MSGRLTIRIRTCLTVLACLALVVGIALPDVSAQVVDSQALVGNWEGTWFIMSHPNYGGDYNMTITKVEGNKVYGKYEKLGAKEGRVASDFVATLDGANFVYSNSFSSTELTMSGKQLRGTSNDNMRLSVQMTKTK